MLLCLLLSGSVSYASARDLLQSSVQLQGYPVDPAPQIYVPAPAPAVQPSNNALKALLTSLQGKCQLPHQLQYWWKLHGILAMSHECKACCRDHTHSYPGSHPIFHAGCHTRCPSYGCSTILHSKYPARNSVAHWRWDLHERRQHCELPTTALSSRHPYPLQL